MKLNNLNVPGELVPAVSAGRGELVRLVSPHPLSAAEHKAYLDLIGGLIEQWSESHRDAGAAKQEVRVLRKRLSEGAACMRKTLSALIATASAEDAELASLSAGENTA